MDDPEAIRERLTNVGFSAITVRGNLGILEGKALALFCSVKCPGSLILQAYDLARALREAGITVISGFHTPMEQECLRLLLRGSQPVIICPARGLEGMRLPAEWKSSLAEGRLLLLSPFESRQRRPTADLAARRNAFVAALAHEILVVHAAPNSKTEAFCRELLVSGQPIVTLQDDENAHLVALGATAVRPDAFVARWKTQTRSGETSITLRELADRLGDHARPDDRFADDLDAIQAAQPLAEFGSPDRQ